MQNYLNLSDTKLRPVLMLRQAAYSIKWVDAGAFSSMTLREKKNIAVDVQSEYAVHLKFSGDGHDANT